MCCNNNRLVDFSIQNIVHDKSQDMDLQIKGSIGFEVKNTGNQTAFIEGMKKLESDETVSFCPPGGGTFASNKKIKFVGTGAKSVEVVIFFEITPPNNNPKC